MGEHALGRAGAAITAATLALIVASILVLVILTIS
jgi:hypothetical protein